jgi:hypothetical protein
VTVSWTLQNCRAGGCWWRSWPAVEGAVHGAGGQRGIGGELAVVAFGPGNDRSSPSVTPQNFKFWNVTKIH